MPIIKEKKMTAHIVVMLLLQFGFRFLPPVFGLPEIGMQVLGSFIGTLYGNTAVFCSRFIWTSCSLIPKSTWDNGVISMRKINLQLSTKTTINSRANKIPTTA